MIVKRLSSYLESNKPHPLSGGISQGPRMLGSNNILTRWDCKVPGRWRVHARGVHRLGACIQHTVEVRLYKISKMRPGKNIYHFIKGFLEDRTIQVHVGGILSGTVMLKMEPFKAWFSVRSLFILMLNDIPTEDPCPDSCRLLLFASDAAIYKSGKDININRLYSNLFQ